MESSSGSDPHEVDQAIQRLVVHREEITYAQIFRVIGALPVRLTSSLVMAFLTLLTSLFAAGWTLHGMYLQLQLPPAPEKPAELQLSAAETVSRYYALLSSGEYDEAWTILTPHNEARHQSWLDWWNKVDRITLSNIATQNATPFQASVSARREFLMKDKRLVGEKKDTIHYLVRGSATEPWRLEGTK